MRKNTITLIAIVLVSSVLTACGGGGTDDTTPPVDPQPVTKVADLCVAKEQFMNCFTVLNGGPAPIDQVTACKAASEGKPMRDSNTVRLECRE